MFPAGLLGGLSPVSQCFWTVLCHEAKPLRAAISYNNCGPLSFWRAWRRVMVMDGCLLPHLEKKIK